MLKKGRIVIILPPKSSNSQYSIVADFDDEDTKLFLQEAYKHFSYDNNIDYDPSHTISINHYGNNQYSMCSCRSHKETLKILKRLIRANIL